MGFNSINDLCLHIFIIQYVAVIVHNVVFNATTMKIARLDWHAEGTTVNRSLKVLKKLYMTAVKNVRNIPIALLHCFFQLHVYNVNNIG